MSTRYAGDLGANAYVVFNAITEFASNPPESLARNEAKWNNLLARDNRRRAAQMKNGLLNDGEQP